MSSNELKTLLISICDLESAGYPFIEMEKVIGSGAAAVPEIIACLTESEEYPEPQDKLPFIVMLGLLKDAAAIPILLPFAMHAERDDYAAAAVEALARIGDPVLPEIQRLLADAQTTPWLRIHLYYALAWIKTSSAHALLQKQLQNTNPLAAFAATAIATYGKTEDSAAIDALYRQSDDTFNGVFEEALHVFVHPMKDSDPLLLDWRVRYRRTLQYGGSPAWSIATVAASLASRREELKSAPVQLKRTLEEIRHECADHTHADTTGGRARFLQSNQFGVMAHPEEIMPLLMMLHTETAFLLRDGCSTIPQAFDTLDLIAEGAHDLSKEKAEQILNDVAIVARALEWFIAHHVYMMDVVVQEISKRYEAELLKHPEDAGPQEKISPAHASAPGRNDLCPCGSGKKFKKCCGL